MYLGIDVGTGTLKAAIFDGDGILVAAAKESYDSPGMTAAGADFDPADWWDACRRVVRRVAASHGPAVTAVGVAGQMHGIVLVDNQGRPVRDAVLWPDQRAVDVLAEFTGFDAEHPGVLGNPIVPGMAGPILAWLGQNEPDALDSASSVVQPKDWLRMQLCESAAATDPSDASATLLYDIMADDWSDAMCAAVRLRRGLLPQIQPSSGVAGPLTRAAAEDLNLNRGIAVVVGSGDAAAALLGAGIEEPGRVLINTGTGGQVMSPIPAPTTGRNPGPAIHQYRSATEKTAWYAMAAVANAGLALDWVRDIVGFDWDQMYATAASVFSAGTSDPTFLPFLSAEREQAGGAPKGGVWSGLTLGHDREALARSALRGIAFYLGLRAKALMELTDVSTAIMSGGAARRADWVELMATVLGLSVTVAPDTQNVTVRGAARLAARGVGNDFPDPPNSHTVEPRADVDIEGLLAAFDAAAMEHFVASA